jgi:hypothetical protein
MGLMQSRLITRGFSSIPHNSALFHIAQSARLKKLVPALVSPTLQFEKTNIYQFLIVFMKRRPFDGGAFLRRAHRPSALFLESRAISSMMRSTVGGRPDRRLQY